MPQGLKKYRSPDLETGAENRGLCQLHHRIEYRHSKRQVISNPY